MNHEVWASPLPQQPQINLYLQEKHQTMQDSGYLNEFQHFENDIVPVFTLREIQSHPLIPERRQRLWRLVSEQVL